MFENLSKDKAISESLLISAIKLFIEEPFTEWPVVSDHQQQILHERLGKQRWI